MIDVWDLLPQIGAPTLVLHSRGDLPIPFKLGLQLARGIPNARFVALESDNHIILSHEPAWGRFAEELVGFLAEDGSGSLKRRDAQTEPRSGYERATSARPVLTASSHRTASPCAARCRRSCNSPILRIDRGRFRELVEARAVRRRHFGRGRAIVIGVRDDAPSVVAGQSGAGAATGQQQQGEQRDGAAHQ